MRIKTENGKCSVNCEGFSAAVGCLQGWTVGKDCPGDMEVLANDGPIILDPVGVDTTDGYVEPTSDNATKTPRKAEIKKQSKKVVDKVKSDLV